MSKEKDLFHGQGNATAKLPKSHKGPTRLTDPHTSPGKTLPTVKRTAKGWNK